MCSLFNMQEVSSEIVLFELSNVLDTCIVKVTCGAFITLEHSHSITTVKCSKIYTT